jgi:hypothetical protein
MSNENSEVINPESDNGLVKFADSVGVVSKFMTEHKETIDKGIDLAGKGVDAVGQGFGELERGTGDALGAIGHGIGDAVGNIGQAVKIATAAPIMIAKFRADQKNLDTLSTVRLSELAVKYKAWAHAFDTEAAQRGQSLGLVEKALDKAIAEGDRDAMLKSLDALIGTLEKTDLTKHSSILTEEWKGTNLSSPPQKPINLLEDNSQSFNPDF